MSSTTTKPPPPELIPGLPNDVALLCLARIPRSQHPIISLVSRPWYASLRSPALFSTRSLLRVSEPFLYLNLRIHNHFSWNVLIHKSHTKRALVNLPSLPIEANASKRQLIGTNLGVKTPVEGSSGNFMSAHLINVPKGELIGTDLGVQEPIVKNLAGNSDQLGQLVGANLGIQQPIEASSGDFMSAHLVNVPKRKQIGANLGVQTSIESSSVNLKNTNLIDVSRRQPFGSSFAVQTPIEPSGENRHVKVEPLGLSHLINVPKRQPIGPSFAVLGSSIYMIGGSHDEIPSNSMWVFDCRFNVWGMGPKMRVGREFSAAGVVDGKIYVMGGCVVDNWARSMNWAEVFDPVKGGWEPVPSPIEVRDKWMHASAVIGGKVYAMADRGGVVYDVRKGEWGSVTKRLDLGWRGRAAVVGGVLYCYDYLGKIRGYDVGEDRWKDLRGVEKGLPKFLCGATMVNFDGRLCVVWEGKGSGKEIEIMCAEIKVKKDEDGGLSGVILWSDVILVVPNSASIVQCLVVEV